MPVPIENESLNRDYLLKLQGISKTFPGVRALNNVHMEIRKGEVHALLGENGAGKSTLMKILSGAYTRDSGKIFWEGNEIEIRSPKEARDLGIGIIYQEYNLVPQLSIAENVWIGREKFSNEALHLINWKAMYDSTQKILNDLHLSLDPRRPVSGLGVAQQQMVEIAKALSLDAKLLIMDEPTSALTNTEIKNLFNVIRTLKKRGVSIIFISHHLEEVFEICERGTILRDGEFIQTVDLADTRQDEIIRLMVGRSLEQQYPKIPAKRGEEALRVENIRVKNTRTEVSFSAYTGESLGIAGLVGAGRTELMRAVFGADKVEKGRVFVFGHQIKRLTPKSAIRAGMGFLPEDRKQQGLVLILSVLENISLASLFKLRGKSGLLHLREERRQVEDFVSRLRITTPGINQLVQYLSGGNQQKVVLAKWLASRSRILIFDEPTRGIDVGAKVEVYNLMNQLVENGVAVIMVSSEMPELLGMSDRILVMHENALVAEMNRLEATQEKVLAAAMGADTHEQN
ncbi:MAG: sugar ABC transporter ATP-binding protein [Anaerolineae bacterium]|nr:sugar ABC transporter ATP-binding protein [Anaerolineae bacterium]